MQRTGHLASPDFYPTTGMDDVCSYKRKPNAFVRARLLRLVWVQDDDLEDKELKAAVVGGPVSVAIEGGTEHDFYKGGVFSDENPKCGDNIDHAVTIVGFTPDIWIIKNSYGTTWGEGGYMRWDRSIANMCGIAELPCYPLIKRKLSHSDEFEEEEEELY